MQESGCCGATSLLISSECDHHSASCCVFPGLLDLIGGPALVTALSDLLQLEGQMLSLSPRIIVYIASSPSYLVKLPPELLT